MCAPGHTGKSSNQTLPHSLAVSLAASTQTVTVNCSSCLVTSPEIILMWQEACPCSLCMPCTGEGEAAAGREHLGILMVLPANAADSQLVHQRRVFIPEHQFVLWEPWELSCLEEGAPGCGAFPGWLTPGSGPSTWVAFGGSGSGR